MASKNDDVQLADFVESVFLSEQVSKRQTRSMLVAKIWGSGSVKMGSNELKITSFCRWKQLRKSQNMLLNLGDSAKDMVTICLIS